MDKVQSPPRTHLFTVRVWLEDLGRGQTEWRGEVQEVVSGERRYFRDWPMLVAFLQATVTPSALIPYPRRCFVSTEQNIQIVRRWREEIWGKGNVNIIDELHAPDFVGHYSGVPGGPIRGREVLKQFFTTYLAAFKIQVTTEFLFAEGDKVAVHDSNQVKHTGPFQGIPPTGKEVTLSSTDIYRIADGRIAEQWFESDFTGGMLKLGVLPTPGHGPR